MLHDIYHLSVGDRDAVYYLPNFLQVKRPWEPGGFVFGKDRGRRRLREEKAPGEFFGVNAVKSHLYRQKAPRHAVVGVACYTLSRQMTFFLVTWRICTSSKQNI